MRVEPNATIADLFERASQSSAWTFAGSVDDVVGVRLHSMAITHRVSDGHGRGQSMSMESLDMPILVGLEMGFKGIEFRLAEGSGLVTWHIYIDAARLS